MLFRLIGETRRDSALAGFKRQRSPGYLGAMGRSEIKQGAELACYHQWEFFSLVVCGNLCA